MRGSLPNEGGRIRLTTAASGENHMSVTKIRGQPVDQAANSSAWASAEACAGADWPYNR